MQSKLGTGQKNEITITHPFGIRQEYVCASILYLPCSVVFIKGDYTMDEIDSSRNSNLESTRKTMRRPKTAYRKSIYSTFSCFD